tara:strand:+ start:12 stop:656 length:645 start_codon:yes stop_codon:yes gene_type:complete
MFSIHNSENIRILNSKFSSNINYDDTIHVIYSNNITFENTKILNAYGDAIDVDISQNIKIDNIIIESAKNDGIDFMESNAEIINAKINDSNDKAISIGENSRVEIFDSILENNKIGIAVKDASKATVSNSVIKDNEVQVAAYAKNWQYGGGGEINILNSKITSNQNNFNTKRDPGEKNKQLNKNLVQNSKIKISNTEIEGLIKVKGDNFFTDNL